MSPVVRLTALAAATLAVDLKVADAVCDFEEDVEAVQRVAAEGEGERGDSEGEGEGEGGRVSE